MTKTFDTVIEEAGFGLSSHLDLTDLRLLYYGRRNVYIAFTDDGEYSFEGGSKELDRPDGIVCYKIEDVVGQKVRTSEFYANVFRIDKSKGEFLEDIRYYKKDDLKNDLTILRAMNVIDKDVLERIITHINRDTTIRFDFMRMWLITEFVSKTKSPRDFGKIWRSILLTMGYSGFSDPSKSGQLLGERDVVTIYIDYERRTDLDILPIQKHRTDPRQRVEDKVERKVKRLNNARRRVAKRRT